MIELLVTVAMVGVVAAIAMSHGSRRSMDLWNAQTQLLADLRRTRNDALTKGQHFRFTVTSATDYQEIRLKLQGANWVADGSAVKTVTLPGNVKFTVGLGTSFEFNTRGLMLNPGAAATLTLNDSGTGKNRSVTVWPSGQVAPA